MGHHLFSLPQAIAGLCLVFAVSASQSFPDGIHLPIQVQRNTPRGLVKRDSLTGSAWLGDLKDLSYNVMVTVGSVQTPVVLDTGSSDLWVISNACGDGCGSQDIPEFQMSELNYSGVDVQLFYGDSQTGTHAFGPIGSSEVTLAGISAPNQYFAAINNTNTSVTSAGSAGILGLGFPINSVIFNDLYQSRLPAPPSQAPPAQRRSETRLKRKRLSSLHHNNRMTTFPTLPARLSELNHPTIATRQNSDGVGTIEDVLASFSSIGPLVTRMVQAEQLESPQVTISLQRDAVDVGGNFGMLSLGSYPSGMTNDTFTWVPIRAYTPAEGGLSPPPDSPNEVYPIAWEVHVDGVYLDGVKLPKSNLSNPDIGTTALIDTGNSLIRGPQDVLSEIYQRLGTSQQGMIPCSEPHTLAFEIGGQMFPIDPRDFIQPAQQGDLNGCWPNIVATDPPAKGFLYSWSFGDPFLKSVVTSFYYGNLTYPSQDPPRMGFASTVPGNANDLLAAAISDAALNGNNFPAMTVPAPSSSPSGLMGYGEPITDIQLPTPTASFVSVPSSTDSIPSFSPMNAAPAQPSANSLPSPAPSHKGGSLKLTTRLPASVVLILGMICLHLF